MITLPLAAILAAAALVTSFISGIFGMAGGIILIGILLALMPLVPAMVLHGATQAVANLWRAWLWRREIVWRIAIYYAAGSGLAAVAFAAVQLTPSKPATLIAIGIISLLGLWLPGRLALDIERHWLAVASGAVCTALHLLAGISGPILDVMFVRSSLDRRQTVATKAAVQAIGHILKFVYFGQLLVSGQDSISPAALSIAIASAIIGTQLSRHALDLLSDTQFRRWSRALIVGIASACMIQGLFLLRHDPAPSTEVAVAELQDGARPHHVPVAGPLRQSLNIQSL
jgi:uncharacterized protein